MDTRKKIVDPDAIPQDGRAPVLVRGYFDPVYAEHARRLRAVAAPGERLIVALDDPASPLLPWRARAELVAGLACVDYVVHGDAPVEGARVVDMREDDTRAQGALEEHVVARHRSA